MAKFFNINVSNYASLAAGSFQVLCITVLLLFALNIIATHFQFIGNATLM